MDSKKTDLLIIGAGPAGSTFARILVPAGMRTVMVDAGPQYSARPGEHLKNSFPFQRNPLSFTNLILGLLHPISIPTVAGSAATVDPIAFRPQTGFVRHGMNPKQHPGKNLENAAALYAVGGMLLLWTGGVPRHHPTLERIPFISHKEWEEYLYPEAEKILNKHDDVYSHSIRHIVVKEALIEHYGNRLQNPYHVQDFPLAAERNAQNSELVRFTGTDTILAPLLNDPEITTDRFAVLPQHRVKRLVQQNGKIAYAEVHELQSGQLLKIYADTYVVACGTVMSAQLLWASGIRPEALGRYLVDHPMAFCQVILRKELVKRMGDILNSAQFAEQRRWMAPHDPLPLPMNDPSANVWIPVSDGRPWHSQITNDVFYYADLPANIDERIIVDFRWYAPMKPRPGNRVTFEEDIFNEFGMPQPTFEFTLSEKDSLILHEMMGDMTNAAQALGGFLPNSGPRFVPWGINLHVQGACRMGAQNDGKCVVDPYSKVWGIDNLYVAGNSVIPTSNACNPTLTNVALALRSASSIAGKKFAEGTLSG
ncbi:MAG TPA: GMC oxidoreductase [Candidatus Binatia bacterium]|nr:GMC oxidoreductase [Candidatus Binatia bacterium]